MPLALLDEVLVEEDDEVLVEEVDELLVEELDPELDDDEPALPPLPTRSVP